jgi:hypothetical protein
MSAYDDLIAGFTARQLGLVARWQMKSAGIPDHVPKARLRSGALVGIFDGVYRLRGVPFTQELRWLAGVLAAGPESWLSFRAAAAFHGFDIRHPKPEVTVTHARKCDLDGIDVHRTRRKHDVIVVRGMPVTTRPRTILDCAAVMNAKAFEVLLQNAVTEGLVKVEAMFAILEHRGGRGVPGTVLTRTALANGLVDEKIQRKLELLLARIIATCAVPKPVRQHRLVCADGREVFLDNAWVDRRVALEAVGLRWHGNAQQAAQTRARSRSITNSGWRHYEYGWWDATDNVEGTRREIEAIWGGSGALCAPDPPQNDDRAA